MIRIRLPLGLAAMFALGALGSAHAEELNLWVRTVSAAPLQKLADLYDKAHPGDKIAVTPITAEQMVPKLGAAIAAGNPPDGAALDLIYTPTFASGGTLEDLTDFIKGLPYFKALSPSHVRLGAYQDHMYGVPFLPDASVVAYNKDLFAKVGLDPNKPPTSFDEIATDAKKITALGNNTYGFYFVANSGSWLAYDFLPEIWAAKADILSDDGLKATIDTPALREVIADYRDMWKAGAIHPTSRSGDGNAAVAAFASGKVGILMTGSYIVNLLHSQYPNVNFGIFPIPGPKGGQSSFAGGDEIVLMKGVSDSKKKLAEDFINFYMQPPQQALITNESGMPPRTDLAQQAFANFDQRNLIAYDMLGHARTPYTFASDQLLVSPTGPLVNLVQGAIFGDDVNGVIAKTQADFTKILDRTNPN